MLLKLERWGIEVSIGGVIIRLVIGDVFIRVPMVGVVAWNHYALCFDRWEDVKKDPIPKF